MQPAKEIKIANPSLESNERTFLTSSASISDTVLNVTSTTGFSELTKDFCVLIGEYGDEKAEIVTVDESSTTTKTLTITSGLQYSHEASDPIVFLPYNKIKIF